MRAAKVRFVLLAVLVAPLYSRSAAHADSTVDVEVTVGEGFQGPPTPNLGYISPPLPNAVRTVAPYDPIPECFVYLEGATPQKPDAPLTVPWSLRSHSFDATVLPVVAGS